MMVAVWGIIKAGAAYVPVDPGFPLDRIEYILKDTAAEVVVCSSTLRSRITLPVTIIEVDKVELSDVHIDEKPLPSQIAYIIYTSGSTGVPKGVMIEHGSLVNRLNWMQRQYPLSGNDIILHKTPFTFDVSVWELFWWSMTGASVYLPEPGAEKYCDRLIDVIGLKGITVVHFVPSMFAVFLDYVEETNSAGKLRSLKQIFTSGEALSSASVKQFNRLMPWCILSNLYGPTEATIDVSYYDCPKKKVPDSIPIGRPIDNTGLYIVDNYLQLQPIGVAGELCISGVNLARGYLNREELTQQKFVNVVWLQEKVYRTGDLARWLPDGNIEYLGRIDDQVKIRGYRIELGEIAAVLQNSGMVKQCAVITKTDSTGNPAIIAYAVSSVNRNDLFTYLKERLPEYMVPAVIMLVDHIPVTKNGKMDKKALPDPESNDMLLNVYEAPRNEMEEILAATWKEMLAIEKIGIYDNFFESGGHSLMIPVLITSIRLKLNVNLVIRDFFTYPTIDKMAGFIKTQQSVEKISA
jgi:amino acid adenylation domain-containing protein